MRGSRLNKAVALGLGVRLWNGSERVTTAQTERAPEDLEGTYQVDASFRSQSL